LLCADHVVLAWDVVGTRPLVFQSVSHQQENYVKINLFPVRFWENVQYFCGFICCNVQEKATSLLQMTRN